MITRRHALALGGGLAALAGLPARAQSVFTPDGEGDMTGALQAAIDDAHARGRTLHLPAGRYACAGIALPPGFALTGVPGRSVLVMNGRNALLHIADADDVLVSALAFDGAGAGGDSANGGLIEIANARNIRLQGCTLDNTAINGIAIYRAGVTVSDCILSGCGETALFAYDSRGVIARGNRIRDCGNGGIRIFRETNGSDGSIITGNRIARIDWTGGGNGQNGNGVNIYRADGVIVSDNHIADCAFTAVRLNTTQNTQVRGNMCLESGEVAIFSEFTFASSVIADNIVDGAAAGISMTNYNEDGRLATCTGNIVRNIAPRSEVNPDTVPYAIAAEADAIVSSNLVEPGNGTGILVGWGPYLRDVTVTGNMVRDAEIGIAVSVAEGAGAAAILDNTVSGARTHAIVAAEWWDVVSTDLPSEAERFANLTVAGNSVL